jgi:hypothetical protein
VRANNNEGGVPVANHAIQPAVTSSFCAARMRAAAPMGDVTFEGAVMTQGRTLPNLMNVNDADTTKGSHAWSPPA